MVDPDLLAIGLAVLFAFAGGSASLRRGRRPGLRTALLAALPAAVLPWLVILLVTGGPRIFSAEYWSPQGKHPVVLLLPALLAIDFALSLVAACAVVWLFHRGSLRKAKADPRAAAAE